MLKIGSGSKTWLIRQSCGLTPTTLMLIRESRPVFKQYMYKKGASLDRVELAPDQTIEDVLLCKGCKNLVLKPSFCGLCTALFCQSCAMRSPEQICPACNTDTLKDGVPQFYRIMLAKYRVLCRNRDEGCDLLLYYENLDEHEDNCNHERLLCSFPGCRVRTNRSNYTLHMVECPMRVLACPHCRQDFRCTELEAHEANCGQKAIICSGCQRSILNMFLPEHLEICDELELACGRCRKVFKKADIGHHKEFDCVSSLLLALRDSSDLSINNLRSEIEDLRGKIIENDKYFNFSCSDCEKVSCEVALRHCDSCRLKFCIDCSKKSCKSCRSCLKQFCTTCYNLSLQSKVCLSCNQPVVLNSADSDKEEKENDKEKENGKETETENCKEKEKDKLKPSASSDKKLGDLSLFDG